MKVIKFIKDSKFRFNVLNERGFFKYMSDKSFIKKAYKLNFGTRLNLTNPHTFNEKIQWLKLYDKNPLYSKMVDKFETKRVVSEKIGEEYLIPTYGIWNKFNEIDFEKLPEQFVLKCTHDSGGVIIVKDKSTMNLDFMRKKINKAIKKNYFYHSREYPYKFIKPRIIAEKFIEDMNRELYDFKFFCFNGQVKFFKIDFNRFTKHQANYYDRNLNLLEFGEKNYPPDPDYHIIMPNCIFDMIKISEKLSENFTFLRVDLYCINEKIFFGEFTFYPASGFGKIIPNVWDMRIGEYLELPTI